MNRRILVLRSPDLAPGIPLPEAFARYAPTLTADHADPAVESLESLAARGYDAVVCWVERPEELELVVRLRKNAGIPPVLVVSSKTEPEFRTLAFQKGAARVLPASRNIPSLLGLIEQSVLSKLAALETRSMVQKNRELTTKIRALTRHTQSLSAETLRRLGRPLQPALLPLLVCDDPDEAFQMIRAFDRAQIFAPLPILRSRDEAMAYLSGRAPYEDRARYPLPTLVLLDLHGEESPGLALLSWIRQESWLHRLPVVMLSAAVNADDIRKAYGVQANSYLIKPGSFEELVAMVMAIRDYWSSLNVSAEPYS